MKTPEQTAEILQRALDRGHALLVLKALRQIVHTPTNMNGREYTTILARPEWHQATFAVFAFVFPALRPFVKDLGVKRCVPAAVPWLRRLIELRRTLNPATAERALYNEMREKGLNP